MNRLLKFAKIESTGNDFILIDCKENHINDLQNSDIIRICDRRLGVGADGLILIDSIGEAKIQMRYFNCDGSVTAVCGNALRAVARFARVMGLTKSHSNINILAGDGIHQAEFLDEQISVQLFAGERVKKITPQEGDFPRGISELYQTDTGVPHLIIPVDDVKKVNVTEEGRRLRFHSYFEPAGTNVNFMQAIDESTLAIRTYERGVEGETLSCGTGVVAAALVCWQDKASFPPLTFHTAGGILQVTKKEEQIFLKGPSKMVFIGQFLLN